MSKTRELTEAQKKFLDVLFNEAGGDATIAKKLAGYSETTRASEIVKSLKNEILELAMNTLALGAPKAAMSLIQLLHNPTTPGADNIIKSAREILSRTGVATKEDVSVKVPQGGLFILPAKQAKQEGYTEEEAVNEDE